MDLLQLGVNMLVTWLGHSCISVTSGSFATVPSAECFWLEGGEVTGIVLSTGTMSNRGASRVPTSGTQQPAEDDLRADGAGLRQTRAARQYHWGVRPLHGPVR